MTMLENRFAHTANRMPGRAATTITIANHRTIIGAAHTAATITAPDIAARTGAGT